jgi:hypothetical protein
VMGSGASKAPKAEEKLRQAQQGTSLLLVAAKENSFTGHFSAAVDAVAGNGSESLHTMLERVGHTATAEEMGGLIDQVVEAAGHLDGSALLCKAGALCQSVANDAPAVIEAVGSILGHIGQHLPVISSVMGLLGDIHSAMRSSHENDENVRTVRLWIRSLSEWMALVANRVDRVGGKSTLPLFGALRTGLVSLHKSCTEQEARGQMTKVLTANSFQV